MRTLEYLEPRRLLAADLLPVVDFQPDTVPLAVDGPAIDLDGDTLAVLATNDADEIIIRRAGDALSVTVNGEVVGELSSSDEVALVRVWGFDGDDRVSIDADLRTWVEGGAGDDTLIGGDASDTLVGGEGDDELFGGDGADYLGGGFGHDGLFGDHGDDLLQAGRGNDALVGGLGDDTFSGGAGRDGLDYSQRSDGGFEFAFPGNVGLLDGTAISLVDLERDVLAVDVENILGTRARDRFFGPAFTENRVLFFDGGLGGDTIFGNFLLESEFAFEADEDRLDFVDDSLAFAFPNFAGGRIGQPIGQPIGVSNVIIDRILESDDRLFLPATTTPPGGVGLLLPGRLEDFQRLGDRPLFTLLRDLGFGENDARAAFLAIRYGERDPEFAPVLVPGGFGVDGPTFVSVDARDRFGRPVLGTSPFVEPFFDPRINLPFDPSPGFVPIDDLSFFDPTTNLPVLPSPTFATRPIVAGRGFLLQGGLLDFAALDDDLLGRRLLREGVPARDVPFVIDDLRRQARGFGLSPALPAFGTTVGTFGAFEGDGFGATVTFGTSGGGTLVR